LRDDLPPPEENEFYWSDLIGLKVVNTAGVELGKVASLLQTGANDVLVVTGERERLIPFVKQVVVDVDKAAAVIQVDWGADYCCGLMSLRCFPPCSTRWPSLVLRAVRWNRRCTN
jgi:16S rRNA processing protein RimM